MGGFVSRVREVLGRWGRGESIYVLSGVLLIFMYFSPVILGGRGFVSDGQRSVYSEPFLFWSDLWSAGWPLGADVTSMSLYPLRAIFSGAGLPLEWFVLSAYLLAYVGMFFFLRRFVCRGAACVGGLLFALSGWMQIHLGHTGMIHSVAWLPWMLFGVELLASESLKSKRGGILALMVSIFMSVSAGHVQVVFYAVFLVCIYAAFRSIQLRNAFVVRMSLLAILFGVLLSAPVLLPLWELGGLTPRAALEAKDIFSYSLSAAELPGLILPLVYGATSQGWYGMDYLNMANSGETITFVPAIAVVLGLMAAFWMRGQRAERAFWMSVLVVSLLLSVGEAFILGKLFTYYMPGFNMFRCPSRHMLEFSVALAVISSFSLNAIMRQGESLRSWRLIPFICSVLVLVSILSVIYFGSSIENRYVVNGKVVFPILVGVAFLVVSVLWIRLCLLGKSGGRQVLLGTIVLAGLQTVFVGYQLSWSSYSGPLSNLDTPEWALRYKEKIGRDYRVLGVGGSQSFVFNPDTTRSAGLMALGWYGPLLNNRVHEVTGLATDGGVWRDVITERSVSLDLFSVKYISITPSEVSWLIPPTSSRWLKVEDIGGEMVFENIRAFPRARFVCGLIGVADDKAMVSALRGGEVDPALLKDRAFVVGSTTGEGAGVSGCASEMARVVMSEADPQNLKFLVESPAPGYLVLADTWFPGWRAEVNGRPAEVLRVNHAMRGVKVDSGRSEVRMVYRSNYFFWGVVISLLSLMLVLSAFIVRGFMASRVSAGHAE